jgi:hypothetical protein
MRNGSARLDIVEPGLLHELGDNPGAASILVGSDPRAIG